MGLSITKKFAELGQSGIDPPLNDWGRLGGNVISLSEVPKLRGRTVPGGTGIPAGLDRLEACPTQKTESFGS